VGEGEEGAWVEAVPLLELLLVLPIVPLLLPIPFISLRL